MPIFAVLAVTAFVLTLVTLVQLIKAMESGEVALVWSRASALVAWALVSILSFELTGCAR